MDETASRPRRRRKTQRVTLNQVAATAGVSPSTVSLFIRRPEAVSEERAHRVAAAIDRLGYVPNLIAGGLAASTSCIVSVIVPSIRNAFFAETVSAIQAALAVEGLQVLLGHTEYNVGQEEALVRAALSWTPAAIILTGLHHSPGTRTLLEAGDVPVVEMWELGEEPIDMAVGFSHEEAGAAAARHLLERGRRNIAYVGARLEEDRRAARRAEGFLRELAAARREEGANPRDARRVIRHPGPAVTDAGALLLKRALQQFSGLDGLVCSNDFVALGVLFESQRLGVRVPEDLAVVGFGDMSFAGSCIPPLTTIRPSGEVVGMEVARLVAERVKGDRAAAGSVIDTSFLLVERRST